MTEPNAAPQANIAQVQNPDGTWPSETQPATTTTVTANPDGSIRYATPHYTTKDLMQHCTAPSPAAPVVMPEEPHVLTIDWPHSGNPVLAVYKRDYDTLRAAFAAMQARVAEMQEELSEAVSRFTDTTAGVAFMRCSPSLPGYIRSLEDAADVKQDEDGITMGGVRLLREDLATAERDLKAEREAAGKMARLLKRYRVETPLGHQPHMIAHEADKAIADFDAALLREET